MAKGKLLMSNIDTYWLIAKEASDKCAESLNKNRTPKPDGTPGYILHGDNGESFKQGMIAITFSGMYLEALTAILLRRARGGDGSERRKQPRSLENRYGGKIQKLGVTTQDLVDEANHFHDVRDDLVHEKSYELSLEPGAINHFPHVRDFVVQTECERAIKLVQQVSDELQRIHGKG
jgi:hypothetical protein